MNTGPNQIDHVVAKINQAWGYINAKQPDFKEALKLLEEINPEKPKLYPKKRKNYYFAKGRALSGLNKFKDAIKALDNIPQNELDGPIGSCKAICYEKLQDYPNAERCLLTIPHGHTNLKVQLSLSQLYEKMGRYLQAIQTLTTIKLPLYSEDERNRLIALGRCYQNMGQPMKAQATFKEIPNWQKHVKVVLCISIVFFEIKNFVEAHNVITQNIDWKNNIDARLILSRISEAIDQFITAKSYLTNVEGWENLRRLRLAMGRICQKAGEFVSAEEHLKSVVDWQNDTEILLSLAQWKRERYFFEEAINYYTKIRNWKFNVHAVMGLFHCYDKINDEVNLKKIINILMANFPNDKQARLTLVVHQESQNSHEDTLIAYSKLTAEFPYYLPVFFNYCRYLMLYNEENTMEVLDQTINKFPYAPYPYLLKAKLFRDNNAMEKAAFILKANIEQFPHHIPSQLELIRHYLLIGETESALSVKKNCRKLFKGHKTLFKRIHLLFDTIPIIRVGGYYGLGVITEEEDSEQAIPPQFKEVWDELKSVPGVTYFTGGTALALYSGASHCYDFDATNSHPDAKDHLPKLGFTQSRKMPQLHVRRTDSEKIDYWCYSGNETTTNWHEYYNVHARDYTITSLLSKKKDNSARFLDLTGMGIYDINHKILRMIGHPKLRLDEIRCIRAAHYMRLGYQPESTLHEALMTFEKDVIYPRHLYTVTKSYLLRPDPESFIEKLVEYRFLQKFFGIEPDENLNKTTMILFEYFKIDNFEILTSSFETLSLNDSTLQNCSPPASWTPLKDNHTETSREKGKEREKVKTKKITLSVEVAINVSVAKAARDETAPPDDNPTLDSQNPASKRKRPKKSKINVEHFVTNYIDEIQGKHSNAINSSELESAKKLVIDRLSTDMTKTQVKKLLPQVFQDTVYTKTNLQLILPYNWGSTYGIEIKILKKNMEEVIPAKNEQPRIPAYKTV